MLTTMTKPREKGDSEVSKVKVQILIAVLKGVLSGELKLCDTSKDHQEDRHSLAGWIQLYVLQEEGWYYDPYFENMHKKQKSSPAPILWTVSARETCKEALGITSYEAHLLFHKDSCMQEKLALALLFEKGFRFYQQRGDQFDSFEIHRDTYVYYTYGGLNERYDFKVERRAYYYRDLWEKYFGEFKE